ncbi:MAG: hypothetical protein RL368_882 [Pseudomonadota bacterium]
MNFRYVTLAMFLVTTQITWVFDPPSKNSGTRSTNLMFTNPIGKLDTNFATPGSCNGTLTFVTNLNGGKCPQQSQQMSNLAVSSSVIRPYQTFYVSFCINTPITYAGLEFVNRNRFDTGRVQLFYDYAASVGCHRIPFVADNNDVGDVSLNVYGVNIDNRGLWNWTNILTTRINVTW